VHPLAHRTEPGQRVLWRFYVNYETEKIACRSAIPVSSAGVLARPDKLAAMHPEECTVSPSEMMERAEASPRHKARMAGLFYLLTFLFAGVASVAAKLVVAGDAAATATNILSHGALFSLGFAAYLVVVGCYVAVTALFYDLFRAVNRSVSLVAAFFSLVGCAIQASICVFLLAPWVLLGGASYLSAFKLEQLQAVSYLSLKLYSQGFDICFVFFGFYCFLIGCLILRSTFLPRILGALMVLAGLGWLTFLSPQLAHSLDPYIRLPGVVGELSLTLWLLFAGVNVEKWKEQARCSRVTASQS
jgi:hypothetical protein